MAGRRSSLPFGHEKRFCPFGVLFLPLAGSERILTRVMKDLVKAALARKGNQRPRFIANSHQVIGLVIKSAGERPSKILGCQLPGRSIIRRRPSSCSALFVQRPEERDRKAMPANDVTGGTRLQPPCFIGVMMLLIWRNRPGCVSSASGGRSSFGGIVLFLSPLLRAARVLVCA